MERALGIVTLNGAKYHYAAVIGRVYWPAAAGVSRQRLTGVTLCMATEDQIQKVVNSLYEVEACNRCGTRLRFGDLDCPRCGADIEDNLRDWAERLVDDLLLKEDED